MQPLYDSEAPKKATNLSLNSDLLKRSRELNINLSATLEQALKPTINASSFSSRMTIDNLSSVPFVTAGSPYSALIEPPSAPTADDGISRHCYEEAAA